MRIKLNYKSYKKQAISVRILTASGGEVTVGTGYLNKAGVLDVCATLPISSGQTVKVFAGFKQVMARAAQPAPGAAPSDICGSASNGSNGSNGNTGARGPRGASSHMDAHPTVTTGNFFTPASAQITEECTTLEDPTNPDSFCLEWTQYLALTVPGGPPGKDGVNGKDGAPGQAGGGRIEEAAGGALS